MFVLCNAISITFPFKGWVFFSVFSLKTWPNLEHLELFAERRDKWQVTAQNICFFWKKKVYTTRDEALSIICNIIHLCFIWFSRIGTSKAKARSDGVISLIAYGCQTLLSYAIQLFKTTSFIPLFCSNVYRLGRLQRKEADVSQIEVADC